MRKRTLTAIKYINGSEDKETNKKKQSIMYATMEQTTILVFNSKEKNKKKIKRKSEKEKKKKETPYVKLRSFSHREKKKEEEQTSKKAHLTVLR